MEFELTVALALLIPLGLSAGMAVIAARRKTLYWFDALLIFVAPLLVFFSGSFINPRSPDALAMTLQWWLTLDLAALALTLRVLLLDHFIRRPRATSIVLLIVVAFMALVSGAVIEPFSLHF